MSKDLPKGLRLRDDETIQVNIYKKDPKTKQTVRTARTFKFRNYDEKLDAIKNALKWKSEIEKRITLGLPMNDDETNTGLSWKLSDALTKTYDQVWSSKNKKTSSDTSLINGTTCVKYLGQNKYLSEITPDDIFQFRAKITAKYSNAYWNRLLTSLVSMMKHAKECGFLGQQMGDSNDFAAKYRLKESNKRHRPFEAEEAALFLETCRKTNDTDYLIFADMVEFTMEVGMRKGEIIGLEKGDLSLIHGVPTVILRAEKTKAGRQRPVPLSDIAFNIWKKYTKGKSQSDIVFQKFNGEPFSASSVTHRFNEIKEKIGLGNDDAIVFHSCRNTFISNAINVSGLSLPEVQQTVGHAQMSTTEVYFKHSKDSVSNIHAKLNKRSNG